MSFERGKNMLLKTRHFGEIEIDENKIIRFDDGLPGFNHVRQFIILETESEEGLCSKSSGELDNKYDAEPGTTESSEEPNSAGSPFKWLQCVDEPMLAFAIANPFLLKPDYDVELSNKVIEHLGIKKEEDVAIYAIVVVPEDITKMTMNLKAPVVINVQNRKGVQAILDTEKYSIRHYIMSNIGNKTTDSTMDKTTGQGFKLMLVLTRKKDQSIIIGDNIEITVLEIQGDQIRIGIDAPKNVAIHRKEVYLEIQEENKKAAQLGSVLPTDLGLASDAVRNIVRVVKKEK